MRRMASISFIYIYMYINIMAITWVPSNGYWRNGRIVGSGQMIDEDGKKSYRGEFNSKGLLTGANCEYIDFGGTNVIIRQGTFVDGKEHGTVVEYTFNRNSWSAFLAGGAGVNSTKITYTFHNGECQSVVSTAGQRIRGQLGRGGIHNACVSLDFTEC